MCSDDEDVGIHGFLQEHVLNPADPLDEFDVDSDALAEGLGRSTLEDAASPAVRRSPDVDRTQPRAVLGSFRRSSAQRDYRVRRAVDAHDHNPTCTRHDSPSATVISWGRNPRLARARHLA
jgi:hypothetical protein